MRTAVKLFDRLDLQPIDGQQQQQQQQEEPGHNVPSLFIRYSGFLFKLLARFDSSVGPVSSSGLTSAHEPLQLQDDGLSEQTSYSQVSAAPANSFFISCPILLQSRMNAKDTDLRELIINGLASLISANTEVGIKQCLPMTYDADPAQRVVFAHVFARVVAKGIRFDPQESQPTSSKQSKLCDVCVQLF